MSVIVRAFMRAFGRALTALALTLIAGTAPARARAIRRPQQRIHTPHTRIARAQNSPAGRRRQIHAVITPSPAAQPCSIADRGASAHKQHHGRTLRCRTALHRQRAASAAARALTVVTRSDRRHNTSIIPVRTCADQTHFEFIRLRRMPLSTMNTFHRAAVLAALATLALSVCTPAARPAMTIAPATATARLIPARRSTHSSSTR